MMRLLPILIFLSLVGTPVFLSAATIAPTTTSSAATVSLANGTLHYVPPADWGAVKSDNEKATTYMSPDKSGFITVVNTPEEVQITEKFKQEMALKIGKAIRDQCKRDGKELLLAPKMEADDRFYMKIHDRIRDPNGGKVADRVQIYRVVGLNFMFVAATAWTDSPDEAAKIHKIGEDVLLSAHLSKPDAKPRPSSATKPVTKPAKPAALAKAKIRVTPPEKWTEERNDAAEGLVVTYHDPDNQTNLIAVSVHPLPKETKKDPQARDIAIQDIVDGEKQSLNVEGGKIVGEPETSKESGYLKKTTTKYETTDGQKFQVDSRMLLVGDVVVSVTSLATADAADAVRQLGDKVATGITPIGR